MDLNIHNSTEDRCSTTNIKHSFQSLSALFEDILRLAILTTITTTQLRQLAWHIKDWQEAQARGVTKKQQAPWLSVDDKMLQAVEVHMNLG